MAGYIGLKQSGFLCNGEEEEAVEEDRLEEKKRIQEERIGFVQVFPHAHFLPLLVFVQYVGKQKSSFHASKAAPPWHVYLQEEEARIMGNTER